MKLAPEQMANLEAEILKRVRACPGMSRVELAKELSISPSTAGNYVARLCAEGFLLEAKDAVSEPGRPPTALRLNSGGGHFIGVDFEAHNLLAMAVDFSDTPLSHLHQVIEPSDGAARIVRKIEAAIEGVRRSSRLLAIGLGVPGLVDATNGIALHYKHIHQWRNVALAGPLAKKFGVPVYLENCVRSMALAELWFGQGRGEKEFVCIGIRTGIGAGIVAGGQLQRGASYHAGEIGRWRFPWPSSALARFFHENGPAADDAELEEVASMGALLAALERARKAKEKTVLSAHRRPLGVPDILRAAQERDPLTVEMIELAADLLGRTVAQLTFALNPSRVILAGPLALLGETLLHPLRRRVEAMLRASDADIPVILNSTMGEYNGALGAAALAVHNWRPHR